MTIAVRKQNGGSDVHAGTRHSARLVFQTIFLRAAMRQYRLRAASRVGSIKLSEEDDSARRTSINSIGVGDDGRG